jgi:hypothetical protein
MITVLQEEYLRMLQMLKQQAEFIVKNYNVDKISEERESVIDFLLMLDDIQTTFIDYMNAIKKYEIDSETDQLLIDGFKLTGQLYEISVKEFNKNDIIATRGSGNRRGNCSDKRLKENIVLLGTTDENIKVYQFNYIFDPMKVKHVGVIAQELLETEYKNNVYMHKDGFYRVDYKHLDMTFDGQLLPFLAK